MCVCFIANINVLNKTLMSTLGVIGPQVYILKNLLKDVENRKILGEPKVLVSQLCKW